MNEFIDKFSEALEKEASGIDSKDKFREYEEWDSLAVLSVIAMIKQNYGITIPRKEFDSLLTVEDLHNYISANKG